MNARLQRSKIKRIRVEKWAGRIRTAAAAERPVGREEPKASKNEGFSRRWRLYCARKIDGMAQREPTVLTGERGTTPTWQRERTLRRLAM
jgi:hypothetical protein